MFINLKTKFNFSSKKKSIVILFIVILLLTVSIAVIFVLKNKTIEPTFVDEVNQENEQIIIEDNEDGIYGVDVKNKYEEVKGTDFAILVTTSDLLEGTETNESIENYKYILENNDNNRIDVIKAPDGTYLDAVFVNYNRLLKDTVVIKDTSGGYIAPYGFTESEETKFNIYNENLSMVILNSAIFLEYPIYDDKYNEIGILYIEDINRQADNELENEISTGRSK